MWWNISGFSSSDVFLIQGAVRGGTTSVISLPMSYSSSFPERPWPCVVNLSITSQGRVGWQPGFKHVAVIIADYHDTRAHSWNIERLSRIFPVEWDFLPKICSYMKWPFPFYCLSSLPAWHYHKMTSFNWNVKWIKRKAFSFMLIWIRHPCSCSYRCKLLDFFSRSESFPPHL